MKKFALLTVITAIFACSQAQSPRVTAEGTDVKVSYGQPSKKDRVIFGELVPFNKIWRAGANEATEITFEKDASFGGQPVKAGTYSLFVIPAEKEWTVILNSELKQWGAFGYDKIKDKDVLKVKVPVKQRDAVAEKLTYSFKDNNNLVIEWDKTMVEIPIK